MVRFIRTLPLLAIATAASCATTWQMRASVEAQSILARCVHSHPPTYLQRCLNEAAAWCRDRHLPNSCAVDGLWGQWPRRGLSHELDGGVDD